MIKASRTTLVFLSAVLMILVAGILAWLFEWEHYEKYFQWNECTISPLDRAALAWLILAKSLWLLFPGFLVSVVLVGCKARKTGVVMLALSTSMVCIWIIADIEAWAIAGNHLYVYLMYLHGQGALEWAGKDNTLITYCITLCGCVSCLVLLSTFCFLFGIPYLFVKMGFAGGSSRCAACVSVVILCVIAVGVIVCPRFSDNQILLERLERQLPAPIYMGLFDTRGNAPHGLGGFRVEFERGARLPFSRISDMVMIPQPASECKLMSNNRPNVIIIVLESFRFDSLSKELMPKLQIHANKGMVWVNHYSGSNCSHLGLFGLLSGRNPLVYHQTLEAKVTPQLMCTLQKAGYRNIYISSGTVDWCGMDDFINQRTFDQCILDLDGEWWQRDKRIVRRISSLINDDSDPQPKCIVSFLMSTHYDYQYPPEYKIHRPVVEDVLQNWPYTRPDLQNIRSELVNRYKNSLAFMDSELCKLIDGMDLEKNIVVITGDHGESFWDDGAFAHSNRGSDVQMRVPMILIGKDVPQRTVHEYTRHQDLVPTLFHLLEEKEIKGHGCHGKDVLSEGFVNKNLALCPYNPRPVLLLLRGNHRCRVELRCDEGAVRVQGFYDMNDRYVDSPTLLVPELWRHVLFEELLRLSAR